jgi:hypothetical protein
MSSAAAPIPPETAIERRFGAEEAGFIRRLADGLAGKADGAAATGNVVIRSILSYQPETPDELLHAARLVALSMTQLDLLNAAGAEAPLAVKSRLANDAMRLERTILQSRKAFAHARKEREARQTAACPAAQPEAAPVVPARPPAQATVPPAAPPAPPPAAAEPRTQRPPPAVPLPAAPRQLTAVHDVKPASKPAVPDEFEAVLAVCMAQETAAARPAMRR